MRQDEIRQTVLQALTSIVPEADPASIEPDLEFREQLDMDSMDFLNFVIALNQRSAIPIPEADYPKLFTMRGLVDYLSG